MVYLSFFVIFGCAAQWGMTLQNNPFWRERGTLKLFSKDVRTILKPLSLAIIGVSATQINSALDAVFARFASLKRLHTYGTRFESSNSLLLLSALHFLALYSLSCQSLSK